MSATRPFILVTAEDLRKEQEKNDVMNSILKNLKEASTNIGLLKANVEEQEMGKVWSEEARAAAAEARRGAGGGGLPSGGGKSDYSPKDVQGKVGDSLDGTDYQPRTGPMATSFPEDDISLHSKTEDGEIHAVKVHDPRDETNKTVFVAVKPGGKDFEGGWERVKDAKDYLSSKKP